MASGLFIKRTQRAAEGDRVTSFASWTDKAESVAYSALNPKATGFEARAGRVYKLIKGYEERRDSENTVASYFVANLMNLFGKSLRENIA